MSKANDDLLEKARLIREKSEAAGTTARKKYKKSKVGKAQKHITDIHETYVEVTGTIGWLYNNIIEPIITHPLTGWPFRTYQKIWTK